MSAENENIAVNLAEAFVNERETEYLTKLRKRYVELKNRCGCLHCQHRFEEERNKLLLLIATECERLTNEVMDPDEWRERYAAKQKELDERLGREPKRKKRRRNDFDDQIA